MTAPEDVPSLEIGECPTMVQYVDISPQSWPTPGSYAHTGEFGTFTDGAIDWFEPNHNPGDLLVFVGISSKTDLSCPAGYTEISNDIWDNAPTTPPIHGGNSDPDGPSANAHVQQFTGYRIAADTWTTENTAKGNYTGFTYTPSPPSYGSDNNNAAFRVYLFRCFEMGGDYTQVAFDSVPVKAGTLVSEDYAMALGPGGGAFVETGTDPGAQPPADVSLTCPDITADHIGNHIWMSIISTHGPLLAEVRTPDNGNHANTMSFFAGSPPNTAIYPNEFRTTGSPGIDSFGVLDADGIRLNEHSAIAYLSNTNYFITGYPDYGFQDETIWPAASILGHTGDGYFDGFIGVAGVDFYGWNIRGGVAIQQLVIQAPESARPFNDNIADAYDLTFCPVAIIECAFGATREVGEVVSPSHTFDSEDTTVWIKWTPTDNFQDVNINTYFEPVDSLPGESGTPFTEYDTMIAVWSGSPGSLTLIDSNDDFPFEFGSGVTVDVSAGTTYYIQVTGYRGDEGRYVLLIDCEGIADYWGILSTVLA